MESFALHVPSPAFREPAAGERPAASRSGTLWLALHFPWLAGEVLSDDGERVLAVSEESRRGWLIYRVSPGIRDRVVWPGMTVSAAGVMCPELAVRRRRPRREERRLGEIADWMQSFSPIVSVRKPETVLLEAGGSLNLFGGLERLKALIGEKLDAAGHVYRIAGAPAPSAAECLARWGRERVVEDKPALRAALGDMPVCLLKLDSRTIARLGKAGIRILRDLWRLPADGLARRFGTTLVRELDRLQGRHPDPRPLHESPLHFSSVLMLDWSTDDLMQITRGVEVLLRQWVDYLRRSARGTSGFSIECLPERGSGRTRLDIGVRRISRDTNHLQQLAVESLSRVRLAGPVAGLVLSSDRIHPFQDRNRQLFETDEEAALQWRQSEELLESHLGGQGLDELYTVAEHRPELAWSTSDPPSAGRPAACGHRPLWLLEAPRPLPWVGKPPRCRDRPRLLRGPERIEAGWWDRHDQRRDYYVATDRRRRRLWVFHDLKHEQWYLHGLFA